MARIEAERAEDVAAEVERQAAFEERQLARQTRGAEDGKEDGDGAVGRLGDGEEEEEEEEEETKGQEIIL